MATYRVRQCNFCGKTYQPITSRNKHCSPECRFKDIASSFSGDDCWNWPLSIFVETGYGQFSWNPGKMQTAHRTSYEVFVGKVPHGKLVLHSCDNRTCFNPMHLRVGTYQDNVNDMMLRKRHHSFDKDRMNSVVIRSIKTKEIKYGKDWGLKLTEAARLTIKKKKDVTIAEQAKGK